MSHTIATGTSARIICMKKMLESSRWLGSLFFCTSAPPSPASPKNAKNARPNWMMPKMPKSAGSRVRASTTVPPNVTS